MTPTASPRRPTETLRRRCCVGGPKRASMREGPLADLFRKSEADTQRPPDRAAAEPEPAAAPEPQQSPPAAPAAAVEERPRVPSPQERLRLAFGSDIPENVLEREPAQPSAPA